MNPDQIDKILDAMVASARAAASLSVDVHAHIEADRVAFQNLTKQLEQNEENRKEMHKENQDARKLMADDIKSLLESRTFQRGMWKAATVIGMVIGSVFSALHTVVPYVIHLAKGN